VRRVTADAARGTDRSDPMASWLPLIALVARVAVQDPAGQDPDYLVALESGYRLGAFRVPASPDGSPVPFTNTGIELPSHVAVRITIAPRHVCSVALGIGRGGKAPRDTLGGGSSVTFAVGPGFVWAGRRARSSNCLVAEASPLTVTVLSPAAVIVIPDTLVRGDTAEARLAVPWAATPRSNGAWEWVSTDSQPAAPARFISGCGSRALTCRFVVPGDGFLRLSQVQVAPSVSLRATSPLLHAIASRMTLTADSTLIHSGSWIVFRARLANGEAVHVESWQWTPLDSAPLGPLAPDCADGPECRTMFQNTSPHGRARRQVAVMTGYARVGRDILQASLSIVVEPTWR
jgi:hypothetical protein